MKTQLEPLVVHDIFPPLLRVKVRISSPFWGRIRTIIERRRREKKGQVTLTQLASFANFFPFSPHNRLNNKNLLKTGLLISLQYTRLLTY